MEDLTTGPPTRHLLKTTSFMLVMMIFQTLYSLIDLYWVGRLGTHAVGRKNHEEAQRMFNQAQAAE
jgi:Na+-driven multidrug efflux pump